MGVPPTLVRVLVGRFGDGGSIAKATRPMSVEQVEAAHLELEVEVQKLGALTPPSQVIKLSGQLHDGGLISWRGRAVVRSGHSMARGCAPATSRPRYVPGEGDHCGRRLRVHPDGQLAGAAVLYERPSGWTQGLLRPDLCGDVCGRVPAGR